MAKTKVKKVKVKKAPAKKAVKVKTKPKAVKGTVVHKVADGIKIIKNADGTFKLSGKNVKGELKDAIVQKIGLDYHFDDRLVPYHVGGESREDNLAIRDSLVKLAKTEEMALLFKAMKDGHFAYRENAKDLLVAALYNIIRGHDDVGKNYLTNDDIQKIHDNNQSKFEEWARMSGPNAAEFAGFDD